VWDGIVRRLETGDSVTTYPIGYGRQVVNFGDLRLRFEPGMHPEYARRLFNWLEAQGGKVGIGGGSRGQGEQPDEPGFAPEGKSFHQYQEFASGTIAYSAVDLVCKNGTGVHRAPRWNEVPAQGSEKAVLWGVHCNVGTPGAIGSEPWHMQPIEIDGWLRWKNGGSLDPVAGYPIPGDPEPEPEPEPTEPIDMRQFIAKFGTRPWVLVDGVDCREATGTDLDVDDLELGGAGTVPPARQVDEAAWTVYAKKAGMI